MSIAHFERIVREEEGQDIIEYALIAGFISVMAWALLQATGQSIQGVWTKISNAVAAAAAAMP
jgi:Flp pilus assembly pilin Flp